MDIRRATPADCDAIVPLVQQYCEVDEHEFDESEVRRALGELLEDDRFGLVYLFEIDSIVIGYAVLTWSYSLEIHGREAVLDEVFLQSEHRNKGYARLMIGQLFNECVSRNIRRVFLETEAANHAAREVYTHLGFEIQDSIWMSINLPVG